MVQRGFLCLFQLRVVDSVFALQFRNRDDDSRVASARANPRIIAGPNNPVGLVWIDLTAPSYGIHGTPEPKNIGKTQSHGCIRLTN
ncbi:MAG: L,D-transpeptidase, partial [Xanthobacteraceae bacterium]